MKDYGLFQFNKRPLAPLLSGLLSASTISLAAENTKNTETEEIERFTTVGSRIRTGGFDQTRPVDIITASSALTQGLGDLSALLRNSTTASGSSQVTSASSTAFVEGGGTGAQTLSLRGLGANRTLVLLNGRRAGPAGISGQLSSFDFNVLPLSIVERVEILKDGASSVYGSDAVAGVVNIITKKLDGANVELSTTQPMDNGGEELRINATYGKTFDHGSFMVTIDHNKTAELAKGQRDYFNCGERNITDITTGERGDVIDPRTGNYHCDDLPWGHVWLYDYASDSNVPSSGDPATLFQYDYNNQFGGLRHYLPAFTNDPNNLEHSIVPAGFYPVKYDRNSDGVSNGDSPFQDAASLIPEIKRNSIFVQADYELSDDHTLYAEALLSRRKLVANSYRQIWAYIYNSNSSGFFPEDSTSIGWEGANWLSPTAVTDISGTKNEIDYTRYVLGLTGDITDHWYYDVSYQRSRSAATYVDQLFYNDSIRDQNSAGIGQAGSCEGTTSSVRKVACVDIPWLDPQFLAGEMSPQVRDYLSGWQQGTTHYKQQTLEGFISGDIFELPAGSVGAVFGAAMQQDELDDTPSETSISGNAWNASSAGITRGDDKTKAVYTELTLPVLNKVFMADLVAIDLSARWTDVDSYGSDTTYKTSINWKINKQLRIRASRGTSFRSPAIYELFLADLTETIGQRDIDVCRDWSNKLAQGRISQVVADNCVAAGLSPDFIGGSVSATVISRGGAELGLTAETSVAKTAGLIWTATFADLNVSVDYFSFDISNQVDQLGAVAIVKKCYESQDFANQAACDLFDRSGLNQGIDNINDSFLNIATQQNRGWDLALNYNVDTSWGSVRLDTQHTLQLESVKSIFVDDPEEFNGQFGEPKHVANYRLSLSKDNWSLNWNANYISAVSNRAAYAKRVGKETISYRETQYNLILEADSIIYHSVSFSYQLPDHNTSIIIGVANAFDEKPPRASQENDGEYETQGNSAFYSQYDWRGRRAFINISYNF